MECQLKPIFIFERFTGTNFREIERLTRMLFARTVNHVIIHDTKTDLYFLGTAGRMCTLKIGQYVIQNQHNLLGDEEFVIMDPEQTHELFINYEQMDSVVSLVIKELEKQDKKGFTTVFDFKNNKDSQLLDAIKKLAFPTETSQTDTINSNVHYIAPTGWNEKLWREQRTKSLKERLIVIASFAIKEYKRLVEVENETKNDKC